MKIERYIFEGPLQGSAGTKRFKCSDCGTEVCSILQRFEVHARAKGFTVFYLNNPKAVYERIFWVNSCV